MRTSDFGTQSATSRSRSRSFGGPPREPKVERIWWRGAVGFREMLLAEDDAALSQQIKSCLVVEGHAVDTVANGEEALFMGQTEPYSLVVLDIDLPERDGISVLKKWREDDVDAAVLILTARDGWSDRVDGLDAGADDYMTKPFQMTELNARVRAMLRRRSNYRSPVFRSEPITFDTRSKQVANDGVPVSLTAQELAVLSYLFHNAGRMISRTELSEQIYDYNAEREEMLRSVAYAFGFVGLLGIAAAALLTSVLVSPLRKLQSDVVNRWESGRALVPEDYRAEVAPLVADIDELLGRNRDILHNGRRQAADLAHALKTPSASLRNELHALGAKSDETAPLFEALDRIDAQIKRSLARMRATTASYDVQAETDLGVAARRLERLFRALPESSDKVFDLDLEPDLVVALDAQDLEEILGNLLGNAFKWCRTQVRLTVASDTAEVRISVEDDGPGIAASLRADALKEGARLDTLVPGTGLGLSITNDLVQAYGGSVELFRSGDLGGLGVRIRLPRGKPPGRGLASADRNRGPETPTPAPGRARVAPLRS